MTTVPSDKKLPKIYHVLMFQANDDSIDRNVVCQIRNSLRDTITSPPNETEIHIWIDSPGGDAHAAYKLATLLRRQCSRLVAVIPDYAKSAATLLAFGADVLYLDDAAELGPLDAQIPHPSREHMVVSALDVVNAPADFAYQAIALANNGGALLFQNTLIPRVEILPSVLRFAAMFYRPLMTHIDPTLVHKAATQLAVAEHYAVRLLHRRDGKPSLAQGDAAHIVNHFVNDFPTHGFVIDREEARSMGLNVENADTHPRWTIGAMLYELFEQKGTTIVSVMTDDDFQRLGNELFGEEENDEAHADDDTGERDSHVDDEAIADGFPSGGSDGAAGSATPA